MAYKIGAQLLAKSDRNVIATVTERRIIAGIPHYRLQIKPNLYNAQPRWLSEYGILLDYEPAGGVRRRPFVLGGFLKGTSS